MLVVLCVCVCGGVSAGRVCLLFPVCVVFLLRECACCSVCVCVCGGVSAGRVCLLFCVLLCICGLCRAADKKKSLGFKSQNVHL